MRKPVIEWWSGGTEKSPDETEPLARLRLQTRPLAKPSQVAAGKREIDSVQKMVVGVGYAVQYPYFETE